MNKYVKQIKDSIIDQNPVLVQFLGMCPTLATTTSVSNAIGMGLAATAVLICSNVFISLLRKFIPETGLFLFTAPVFNQRKKYIPEQRLQVQSAVQCK